MKKLILVPTDFTEVGEAALKYAFSISKQQNFNICLLNVVDHVSKIKASENKLDLIAKHYEDQYRLKTLVAVGNIFDEIGFVADEIDASLVVMGTHGLKGFQFLTGSNALKVIGRAKCPFIVVQKNTAVKDLSNILFPVDVNKLTRIKLKETIQLAQLFQAKVRLVAPKTTDVFEKKSIHENVTWVKKELNKHCVSYSVNYLDSKNFMSNMYAFADENGIDMFSMVNSQTTKITGVLTATNEEQKFITNPLSIPVLTVNISQKVMDNLSLSNFAGVS